MPKLNVQQNNQNVIQAFENALAIGNLKGIIASDGNHNFSASGTNPNLLDNPWFTVRQRGNGPFTSGYTVDRWKVSGGTPTITPRSPYGINISASSAFAFDEFTGMDSAALLGKTVTLSALIGGVVYSGTGTYTSSTSINISVQAGGIYVRLVYDANHPQIRIYGAGTNNVDLDAVKLELGSVSTLANDAPPDYDKELDHCKWYFERIKAQTTYSSFGNGFGETTTSGQMQVPMHPKRTTNYTVSTSGSFTLYNGAQNRAVSALARATSGLGQNVLCLTATATSLVQGSMYALLANNDASACIDISADL